MDITRIKRLSKSKIQAGDMTKKVRDILKEYDREKQDLQLGLEETFKPIAEAQEETKRTIDEKQDKMIEQLQKKSNQNC